MTVIKIYSEVDDVSSVMAGLKQLELRHDNIQILQPQEFEAEEYEIIIFQLTDINSRYLSKINELKNNDSIKAVFIVQENNALLLSTIVKLGFTNVFILPYEIYKFTSFLSDLINDQDPTSLNSFGDDNFAMRSLIGSSPRFRRIIELSKKIAERSDVNILILGETGTGKGMLAHAIHNLAFGQNSPFVDIVCTSIPESLMESELFGHERGAYTNALNKKFGLFEVAENGTLFLDEIGDLSLNIQAKLLRTIEKKIIRRLGGVADIPINARIISATNRNLEEMIQKKIFRRDLYHRLNVVTIELPPLRERGEDILALAFHFIREFNSQFDKIVTKLDNEVKEFLLLYPWPGNVRELKNSMERAVLLCEGNILNISYFSNLTKKYSAKPSEQKPQQQLMPHLIRMDLDYKEIDLKEVNKRYAKEVLQKMNGNKSKTAKFLGISRPKLDSLINC